VVFVDAIDRQFGLVGLYFLLVEFYTFFNLLFPFLLFRLRFNVGLKVLSTYGFGEREGFRFA
jgi:hypothetical protein